MKLLVDTKQFYDSLANSEERDKLKKYLSSGKSFENMPLMEVEIPESKTPTQLHTIWRDFGIIARLLYTHRDVIYAESMKHEQLRAFFLKETEYGLEGKKKKSWRLHTLSQFSRKDCFDFIPMMREVWHGIINNEYQEFININWSEQENIDKPDYEKIKS